MNLLAIPSKDVQRVLGSSCAPKVVDDKTEFARSLVEDPALMLANGVSPYVVAELVLEQARRLARCNDGGLMESVLRPLPKS